MVDINTNRTPYRYAFALHFRSHESNRRNAQLLVSSHHVSLLDDLEKEELFIVEKDDEEGLHLHLDVRPAFRW